MLQASVIRTAILLTPHWLPGAAALDLTSGVCAGGADYLHRSGHWIGNAFEDITVLIAEDHITLGPGDGIGLAEAVEHAVSEDVHCYIGQHEVYDDLTLLMMKYRGADPQIVSDNAGHCLLIPDRI